jgi:hypothetical protein
MKPIRSYVLVSLLALAVPVSAPAFLLHYTITTDQGTFDYDIVAEPEPHWTLTVPGTDGGAEVVYQGQALDTAKFSGELALSFSDSENITRDGQPVEAQLKGKIGGECDKAKITLKDTTNDVTITLDSKEAAGQTCSGNL